MADNPNLVRDDELEEEARRDREAFLARRAAAAAAPPPPAARPWEAAETLPSARASTGPQPWERAEGLSATQPATLPSAQMQTRIGELQGKLNPPRAATRLGRIGHTLGVIGQDIGVAAEPGIMANIPGTTLNRRLELHRLQGELGPELEREAHEEREREQTGIQERTLGMEEKKAGLPHMLPPGPETVRTDDATNQRENLWEIPGQPTQWVPEGGYPQMGQPLPSAGPPGTLPTAGAQPTPPPAAAEGTLPKAQTPATAPPMAAPQVAQPRYTYGKPAEGQIPLRPPEIQQVNDEAKSFWARLNKGAAVPPQYQLKLGANKEDAARLQEMLKAEQTAAGTQAQREFTQEETRQREQRQQQEEARRKEEAGGKWLRAVDNEDKVHLITRGDYEARQRDFKPNAGTVPPGEIDKATDHNTVLNEMQGRMNAIAESAVNFNWADGGQKNIVIQAMQRLEESYPDKILGIPIIDFVAQNLKKLGMSGATPETREYIIDLMSLREAMLGMPKEITGGSRMMEKSIEALYATLPSGTTPDRTWAMKQLQATQSIIDRLRGSRVPIIEGLHQVQKVPNLYKYNATNPQTKQEIFSDDKKVWVDETGRPVR